MGRCSVRNTGARPGADVVQVDATLPETSAPPRLATRDPARHEWQPPAGEYLLQVARFAVDPDGIAIEVLL